MWNPDPGTLLLALAIALALIGALRFDLLGLIWREGLKLARPSEPAPPEPTPASAHGPYVADSHERAAHGQQAAQRPAFHRSGRRG